MPNNSTTSSTTLRRAACIATAALASTSVTSAQTLDWAFQFGGPDLDSAWDIAADGAGGFFVGGKTRSQGSIGDGDAWIARFDASQNLLWTHQWGTTNRDIASELTGDGSGGVLVVGYSGPPFGPRDYFLANYDGSGTLRWLERLFSSTPANVRDIARAESGSVYLCGAAGGALGGSNAGGSDAFLASYDSSGQLVWIRQFGTTDFEEAAAVAIDEDGNILVAGWTRGDLGGVSAGDNDVFLAKYDRFGNQLWIEQFGTPASEAGKAVVPDGSGGALVASGFLNGNTGGVQITHFDASATRTWTTTATTDDTVIVSDAVPDGRGGLYVGGTTLGDLVGSNTSPGFCGGSSYDAWLLRCDSQGVITWGHQFGVACSTHCEGLAYDGSGGFIATGETVGQLFGGQPGGSVWVARYETPFVRYCSPATPNSTGQSSVISWTGSSSVTSNDLVLIADRLPANTPGFFLTSNTADSVPAAGGSSGTLCLGGHVGRFVGPGQVQDSGFLGSFALALDLASTPTPTGLVQVQPGEGWYFQAWHRDTFQGQPTSNFTDAISVVFH